MVELITEHFSKPQKNTVSRRPRKTGRKKGAKVRKAVTWEQFVRERMVTYDNKPLIMQMPEHLQQAVKIGMSLDSAFDSLMVYEQLQLVEHPELTSFLRDIQLKFCKLFKKGILDQCSKAF